MCQLHALHDAELREQVGKKTVCYAWLPAFESAYMSATLGHQFKTHMLIVELLAQLLFLDMGVLTRCRSKTPESEAMRPSPNPRKLKKAAKKVKAMKKGGNSGSEDFKTPPPRSILKTLKDTCVQSLSTGMDYENQVLYPYIA